MAAAKQLRQPSRAICDACVLINLAVINELQLLGRMDHVRFYVPQAALDEVMLAGQRQKLQGAISKGWLKKVTLDSDLEHAIATELRSLFGEGESVCLAIAQARQWYVVTDEVGALPAEIEKRVGPRRKIDTVAMLVEAVRRGWLSVAQADAHKATLEAHKFRMKFGSFGDIL